MLRKQLLIILTFHWHPTPWWSQGPWSHQQIFSATFIKAFVWLWHCRDIQLPSTITLDEFVIVIEKHSRKFFFRPEFAAKSDGLSPSHRMDGAHQDNTIIIICETVREYDIYSEIKFKLKHCTLIRMSNFQRRKNVLKLKKNKKTKHEYEFLTWFWF